MLRPIWVSIRGSRPEPWASLGARFRRADHDRDATPAEPGGCGGFYVQPYLLAEVDYLGDGVEVDAAPVEELGDGVDPAFEATRRNVEDGPAPGFEQRS
jgi:hypothetical protein